jgi:hypothetical protein
MYLLQLSNILKKYILLQGNIGNVKDTDDINIEQCNLPEFSPNPDIGLIYCTRQYVALLTTERTERYERFTSLIHRK